MFDSTTIVFCDKAKNSVLSQTKTAEPKSGPAAASSKKHSD